MSTSQETLIKNGIKIVQISASYDRKVSDGQYGSMGGFFSMTADVDPVAALEDQIDLLYNFVRDAAAKHLRPEFNKVKADNAAKIETAINPEKSISPEVPTNVSPAVAAAKPAPQTVPAPAQDAFTLDIVRVQTTPRADGKVDIKFFCDGHQYPDIYATKTIADACAMLGQVPAYLSVARDFPMNLIITYVNSTKLSSKGKPYKDIVSVKKA